MNGLNLYITVSAVVLGILSALLNFTGRQKYKDNASFFESANSELRQQNTALRDEKTVLTKQLAETQAASQQKDETIKQLKPFSDIAKIMSNNHREIMTTMSANFSKVTELLSEKIDGK